MKRYRKLLLILPGIVALASGCKKYDVAPQIAEPSYMRVFNNITASVDVLHAGQAAPFLTFLMDPQMDGNTPMDAATVGDYLTSRKLFSLSYPINEANSSIGDGTIGPFGNPDPPVLYPQNYDYPGNAHVLTAPVINGFDLSSWAQIPSGKHRLMFVVRPQNSIPFKQLSKEQRSVIMLDTTVNFQKGEVYTLEVVARNLDKNNYGLYVRKEQFIHQAFDQNRIYTGFVNLSGETPASAQYGTKYYFPKKIKINYTYFIANDAASSPSYGTVFDVVPGYNNLYYSTLTTKRDTAVSYFSVPQQSVKSFFYQGVMRLYADLTNPFSNSLTGSMPHLDYTMVDADDPEIVTSTPFKGFQLSASANPTTFNNYNAETTQARNFTVNQTALVNINNIFQAYSTLNIMEISNDRVYMMQIQRGINNLSK